MPINISENRAQPQREGEFQCKIHSIIPLLHRFDSTIYLIWFESSGWGKMAPRRKRKGKAGLTEISALDDYLLMLILSRLPMKLLHRSKCVSKLWNTLISTAFPPQKLGGNSGFLAFDPRWACGYVPRFHHLFPQRIDYAVRFDMSLNFLPTPPDYKILTAQNGLLLCVGAHDLWLNFYVYNPLTKKSYTVPMPEDFHGTNSNFIALDFDPTISLRYKIIRSLRTCCVQPENAFRPPLYLELEIFSSETQKWEKRNVFHGPYGACLPGHVVLLNSIMYKLVHPKYVVGFGFEEQNTRTLQSNLPDGANFPGTGCLTNWGGRLHYTSWDNVFLTIWRVRDFSNSVWEMIHVNSFASMRGIVYRDCSRIVSGDALLPLAGHAPDSKLLFLDNDGVVLGYDFPSRSMERLSALLPWNPVYKDCKLLPFRPCLFNPGRIPSVIIHPQDI
ncbi:F-box protein At5g18160-like [Aristolochia californica]|uniref:F-box protein At5g18160-like n=1 Tax=Aristolochia californica TaxID=171875 RepID=UPI0035DF4593